jgi:single stranded DNA-binding protein
MNINRVVMTGNLTRDPELRTTGGGLAICKLRIACNTRRKNGATGEWEDRPNYFDVTVFGGQGESASRFLSKGRPVAIDGRLEWREYEVDRQRERVLRYRERGWRERRPDRHRRFRARTRARRSRRRRYSVLGAKI